MTTDANHLDTEVVHRVLHAELADDRRPFVNAHLEACQACRDAVERARAEEHALDALLASLDHPMPLTTAHALLRRGRHRRRALLARWAAGLFIAVMTAGAAFALPWSPLRRWLSERTVIPPSPHSTQTATDSASKETGANLAGVTVAPGSALVVRFLSSQEAGELHIALSDGGSVEVQGRASVATFAASAGSVVVDNHGARDSYDIHVPRNAPRVDVFIADEMVWSKRGERINASRAPDPSDASDVRISFAR